MANLIIMINVLYCNGKYRHQSDPLRHTNQPGHVHLASGAAYLNTVTVVCATFPLPLPPAKAPSSGSADEFQVPDQAAEGADHSNPHAVQRATLAPSSNSR